MQTLEFAWCGEKGKGAEVKTLTCLLSFDKENVIPVLREAKGHLTEEAREKIIQIKVRMDKNLQLHEYRAEVDTKKQCIVFYTRKIVNSMGKKDFDL
ncbi:MAG: hypothetical protein ACLU8F_03365 [Clostridia bacterium]